MYSLVPNVLLGKEVYFPWGVDRNGINIEFTVEKNTKRKMKTYEREEFLNLCRDTIETFTQAMRKTAARVGLSCDFAAEYLTDAPDYRSVTQSIFIELFKKGDIVEDLRPNIYNRVEGTTIADAEVERIGRMTKLVDVRWNTEDGEELVISTTRPECVRLRRGCRSSRRQTIPTSRRQEANSSCGSWT